MRFNLTDNDSDEDGTIDPNSIVIVNWPEKVLEITVHGDGTVTVTRLNGTRSDRSFTYTVEDNLGATSNIATVEVGAN